MAELKFEAPLAKFECEEWNEFNDYQTAADEENSNKDSEKGFNENEKTETKSAVDNFNEFSGSIEDLVNSFDEKISKCFKNWDEKVEKIAPVQVRTQEEIMNDCQMWWTITGNFGNILPIDWSKSYTRQLHTKALNLGEKRDRDSPDLDLSDDEELSQSFDMHSLIISSFQEGPLYTAAEVIKEIEDMMQDDDEDDDLLTPSDVDMLSPSSTELHQISMNIKERLGTDTTPANFEEKHPGLKNLSLAALNELYDELEKAVKTYSETLIHELALRDELEYEKELKNSFISLVLNVQKKRRDCQTEKKKNNNTKKYVTTVIPYHAGSGTPSNEQLQTYNKLLTAILDDSPMVPGLLTDYILKVLCPTA